MLKAYWISSLLVGSYIAGYENSIPRNKGDDWKRIVKYIILSPVTVPNYLWDQTN
jgi:hypothetical protein